MKTTLSLCLALVAFGSAHAQVFRPEAVNGAILGGIAGGIIGHNSGDLRHNGWKGAAIGSAAGLLIGQAVGDARADRDAAIYGYPAGGYVYRSAPRVSIGVGYGVYRGGHGHGRYGSGYGYPGSRYGFGSHRSHGWHVSYAPGFGYYRGYGLGYPNITYGDYVDYVSRPATVVVPQPQPVAVQAPAPQAQPVPQQVTIINNYYNTSPMSSANGLFGR